MHLLKEEEEDDQLRKAWIHYCRRSNFDPTSGHRLCSAHFTRDCFERDPFRMMELGVDGTFKRRRRKKMAKLQLFNIYTFPGEHYRSVKRPRYVIFNITTLHMCKGQSIRSKIINDIRVQVVVQKQVIIIPPPLFFAIYHDQTITGCIHQALHVVIPLKLHSLYTSVIISFQFHKLLVHVYIRSPHTCTYVHILTFTKCKQITILFLTHI